ncbi:MAG: hypothetical protein WD872_10110 [Pirellulaceae bacterium]
MRLFLLLLVVAASGCKTAEFAVTHPVTGVHVVAKFESQEPAPYDAEAVGPSTEL